MLLSGVPPGFRQGHADALGLKVSQFVSIMGDTPRDKKEDFLLQSQARERIRALVEKLEAESPE